MSRLGEAKQEKREKRKVVQLVKVTLPAEARQLDHAPELCRPSRRVRDPNVNGCLTFAKQSAKSYFGNSRGGLEPKGQWF